MTPTKLDVRDLLDLLDEDEDQAVRAQLAACSCKELERLRTDIDHERLDAVSCGCGYDSRRYDDLIDMVDVQWHVQRAIDDRLCALYAEAMATKYADDPKRLHDVIARYGLVVVAEVEASR